MPVALKNSFPRTRPKSWGSFLLLNEDGREGEYIRNVLMYIVYRYIHDVPIFEHTYFYNYICMFEVIYEKYFTWWSFRQYLHTWMWIYGTGIYIKPTCTLRYDNFQNGFCIHLITRIFWIPTTEIMVRRETENVTASAIHIHALHYTRYITQYSSHKWIFHAVPWIIRLFQIQREGKWFNIANT